MVLCTFRPRIQGSGVNNFPGTRESSPGWSLNHIVCSSGLAVGDVGGGVGASDAVVLWWRHLFLHHHKGGARWTNCSWIRWVASLVGRWPEGFTTHYNMQIENMANIANVANCSWISRAAFLVRCWDGRVTRLNNTLKVLCCQLFGGMAMKCNFCLQDMFVIESFADAFENKLSTFLGELLWK